MSKQREVTLTHVKVEASKKVPNLTDVKLGERKEANLTEVKFQDGKTPSLVAVKVDGRNGRMSTARESEFVYVNSAFVGSVNNVNSVSNVQNMNGTRRNNRASAAPATPITEVYREQYWACSRWPYTQRVLAITVGVLLGALIGLIISLLLRDEDDPNVIGPIFTRQHIAPD